MFYNEHVLFLYSEINCFHKEIIQVAMWRIKWNRLGPETEKLTDY